MKKLLIFALSISIFNLFVGCTEEDAKSSSTLQLKPEGSLSEDLKTINNELMYTLYYTRGDGKPEQDSTKTDIVEADAIGAVAGAVAGLYAGSETKNAIATGALTVFCAVIGAVCNSIAASGYSVKSDEDMTTFFADITNVVNQYNFSDSTYSNSIYLNQSLNLPETTTQANKVGIMHNMILDQYFNCKETKELTSMNREDEILSYFNQHKDYYNKMLEEGLNWKQNLRKDYSSNVGKIFNSFMEIYRYGISESNTDNTLKIEKTYIDFIKGRDDITSDEKESLLMGLSVAWHSFCYWKEKYNWNQ